VAAAFNLIQRTHKDIINHATTGKQPPRNTPLHMCSDGSDKGFRRAELASDLIGRNANIEAEDARGNTPLLLASGCGITDVIQVLIDAGANKSATNYKNKGILQKADAVSSSSTKVLRTAGAQMTYSEESGCTRTGTSFVRQTRYLTAGMDDSMHVRKGIIKGKGKGKVPARGAQSSAELDALARNMWSRYRW
jgi:ankyrin repeat protein